MQREWFWASVLYLGLSCGSLYAQEQLRVVGNTVLSPRQIEEVVGAYGNKPIDRKDLEILAKELSRLYEEAGYITSRVEVTSDNTLKAVEGQLERVEIRGVKRTDPEYIRSRILLNQPPVLNIKEISDRVQLLNNDPSFSKVSITLSRGSRENSSVLEVMVEEAQEAGGFTAIDNLATAGVGEQEASVGLTLRNPSGIGDEMTISYNGSFTGGLRKGEWSYLIPVGPTQGTVFLRFAPTSFRITQPPFDQLNIRGDSRTYEITYRQPLIRSFREELALSLGLTRQEGQTFIFNDLGTPFSIGPEADGTTRTTVIKLGQEYIARSLDGAWFLKSQFNLGTGLLGGTYAENTPTANFLSWNGQLQRAQFLSPDSVLTLSLESQLSADPLLPPHQFTIGGANSVRGFQQGIRSGDNGLRLSLETRFTLARDDQTRRRILDIAPFLDLGTVWNHTQNPNPIPNQNFLISTGLSTVFEPIPRLLLKLDWGIPLVPLTDRKNREIHFSLSYGF